jgi:D-alanyl-D-alanine dipeptidase
MTKFHLKTILITILAIRSQESVMTIDLSGTRVWIAELCPEIEAWQVDLIVDHIESQLLTAEREACAKVCEDTDIVDFEHCMVLHQDAAKTLTNAAAAIRSRGEVQP